jgi:hypothetical protein
VTRTGRPRWHPRLRRLRRAHVVGEAAPLPDVIRKAAYRRQTGRWALTPAQRRRARHKRNRLTREEP